MNFNELKCYMLKLEYIFKYLSYKTLYAYTNNFPVNNNTLYLRHIY